MHQLTLGILLILLGGLMEGGYALPLKFTPRWKWENTWGAASLMALLTIPWPVAIVTIPGLLEVYQASSPGSLWLAIGYGAGWGIGGVLFGLGVNAVGMSLGLSLIMGLIAINGSLLPLIMEHPEQFSQTSGMMVLAGIVIMLMGLIVVGWAGHMKDRVLRAAEGVGQRRQSAGAAYNFRVGLFFCVASGVLSPMVNFALIYGQGITDQAIRHGADPANAGNAVWALVFTSNYLVNVGYCVYLGLRNRTADRFITTGTGRYWLAATVMGALWAGGIVLYGVGAYQIGQYGPYIGFPILLITSILTGNILGVLTGEWRGAGNRPPRLMAAGVSVLILAVAVFAYANSLMS